MLDRTTPEILLMPREPHNCFRPRYSSSEKRTVTGRVLILPIWLDPFTFSGPVCSKLVTLSAGRRGRQWNERPDSRNGPSVDIDCQSPPEQGNGNHQPLFPLEPHQYSLH